jgi:hypothetical protein
LNELLSSGVSCAYEADRIERIDVMTIPRSLLLALLALISVPYANAQEKQASVSQEAQSAAPQVPLKMQFLVTEYDGTKKIASLPYTATGITSHPGKRDSQGILRVGARIPLPLDSTEKTGEEKTTTTYIDVGTNIDYWVWPWTDNRYLVSGNVDLSSLEGRVSGNEPKESASAGLTLPIVYQTRADFSIVLRDGQPGDALSVTDPITGHVFKLEVTVDVMK